MTTSIVSRIRRSFQLRATSVTLDDNALQFVTEDSDSYGVIQIVSHGPDGDDETEYRNKIRDERHYSHIPSRAPIIFLEVYPSDSSDFEEDLVPAAREILGEYVAVGAQDLSTEDAGAFTREVSGATIAEFGCSVVEVGHAERRRLFGETDDVVRAKTASALRNGLTPVLCVGEATQGIREDAVSECIRQFDDAASTGRRAGSSGGIIVAYEPLWAIGASEPASPEYIRAVFGPCGSTCAIRRGGCALYRDLRWKGRPWSAHGDLQRGRRCLPRSLRTRSRCHRADPRRSARACVGYFRLLITSPCRRYGCHKPSTRSTQESRWNVEVSGIESTILFWAG